MPLGIAFQVNDTNEILEILSSPEYDRNSDEAYEQFLHVIEKSNEAVIKKMVQIGVARNRLREAGDLHIHVLARAGSSITAWCAQNDYSLLYQKNSSGETPLSIAKNLDDQALYDLLTLSQPIVKKTKHRFCSIQ